MRLTQVNTLFMKWFSVNYVTVGAAGNASRRDVVAMLVLDRSFSIQMAGECSTMIAAAKAFTGSICGRPGQHRTGVLWRRCADGAGSHHQLPERPRSYTANDSGSGTGLLHRLHSLPQGNTNTASAISVAYNQLWTANLLRGALNVLVLKQDGLPPRTHWRSTSGTLPTT